ncbi:hypothetical protein SAMN05421690_104521 [Nitrosomonas sp. Nm51]|nr:hypothetical protein SAMN05421690_104521 [Nitrosomonas sp. Nm51]
MHTKALLLYINTGTEKLTRHNAVSTAPFLQSMAQVLQVHIPAKLTSFLDKSAFRFTAIDFNLLFIKSYNFLDKDLN